MSCVRNAMSGICRLALALCGAFAAARGDSMKVSVWRGESASFFVSDEYPEIGGEAPGVTVRRGTLLPVRYNEGIHSLSYRFKADRAVYGSKSAGLHFATVTAAADAKAGEYRFGQLVVRVDVGVPKEKIVERKIVL